MSECFHVWITMPCRSLTRKENNFGREHRRDARGYRTATTAGTVTKVKRPVYDSRFVDSSSSIVSTWIFAIAVSADVIIVLVTISGLFWIHESEGFYAGRMWVLYWLPKGPNCGPAGWPNIFSAANRKSIQVRGEGVDMPLFESLLLIIRPWNAFSSFSCWCR